MPLAAGAGRGRRGPSRAGGDQCWVRCLGLTWLADCCDTGAAARWPKCHSSSPRRPLNPLPPTPTHPSHSTDPVQARGRVTLEDVPTPSATTSRGCCHRTHARPAPSHACGGPTATPPHPPPTPPPPKCRAPNIVHAHSTRSASGQGPPATATASGGLSGDRRRWTATEPPRGGVARSATLGESFQPTPPSLRSPSPRDLFHSIRAVNGASSTATPLASTASTAVTGGGRRAAGGANPTCGHEFTRKGATPRGRVVVGRHPTPLRRPLCPSPWRQCSPASP